MSSNGSIAVVLARLVRKGAKKTMDNRIVIESIADLISNFARDEILGWVLVFANSLAVALDEPLNSPSVYILTIWLKISLKPQPATCCSKIAWYAEC
jgi:hypothetical protein